MVIQQQLLLGILASIIIMLFTWLFCIKDNNGSWVDVVWAYTIGLLATVYLLLNNNHALVIVPYLFTVIWSIRLGTHLLLRVSGGEEDGRYQQLKKIWGGVKSPKMFGFFMIQALAAFVFSLPALCAMQIIGNQWNTYTLIGTGIAFIALVGEHVADKQLKRFKQNSQNDKDVCNVGLWRYSRHPNYFFEWIFWFSYPALILNDYRFWVLMMPPLIIYLLITKFSGIPPTEAQAIRKRGEAYKQYMNETNTLIPWFPKAGHSK